MDYLILITSARGPGESAFVVAHTMHLFLREARKEGCEAKILKQVEGPGKGTFHSGLIDLKGRNCEDFLFSWEGVIQWQGHSPYRLFSRSREWKALVAMRSAPKRNRLKESEVRYERLAASSSRSAVRAIHLASGIAVIVNESRSHHHNRKAALPKLERKLNEVNQLSWVDKIENQFAIGNRLEALSPVRIYAGSAFDLIYVNQPAAVASG